jgi:hypothetical protein
MCPHAPRVSGCASLRKRGEDQWHRKAPNERTRVEELNHVGNGSMLSRWLLHRDQRGRIHQYIEGSTLDSYMCFRCVATRASHNLIAEISSPRCRTRSSKQVMICCWSSQCSDSSKGASMDCRSKIAGATSFCREGGWVCGYDSWVQKWFDEDATTTPTQPLASWGGEDC